MAEALSGRELDIIAGYAQGRTAARIARELGISAKAVFAITARLAKRLGIEGARQSALVDYAYRHGHLTVTRNRELRPLPRRLAEVLDCATRGLSYNATAAELGLSPRTIRRHRDRLHRALGVHSTARAVAVAWEGGLRTSGTEAREQ